MFRTLLPLFALIVALALFFTYVKPTFDEVKLIQDETQEYVDAVEKAEQLRQRVAELISQRNSISQRDLERLETMLPDKVDEVELLIALSSLADAHNLQFSSISVSGGVGESPEQELGLTDGGRAESAEGNKKGYIPFRVGFTVAGPYDDFRAFLAALEQSLNFVEVTGLVFNGPDAPGSPTNYRLTLQAFTLAPSNN